MPTTENTSFPTATSKSPALLAHRAIEDLALEAENSVEQILRLVDRLHKADTPIEGPSPSTGIHSSPSEETPTEEEFEPEVAQIPRLEWQRCLETFNILHPKCKREYLEQFRRLRARLTLARKEWQAGGLPLQVIGILSSSSTDGKTFVAANLAAALALGNEQRVLVIDANPMTQTMTGLLGAETGNGLTDAMRGGDLELSLRQAGETNLYFMPANCSGGNFHGGMDLRGLPALLERLRAEFQWIILDAPASDESSDAELLANFADGNLVVARKGLTSFREMAKIMESVPEGRVVGAVFNNEGWREKRWWPFGPRARKV